MSDRSSKSTSQIVREVEESRQRLLDEVDHFQNQFRPENLFDQAREAVLNSGGSEFTRNMGRSVRDNPLPVALIGAGIAWMIAGQGGPRSSDIADQGRSFADRFRGDGGDDGVDSYGDPFEPVEPLEPADPVDPVLAAPIPPGGRRVVTHDVEGREMSQTEIADTETGPGFAGRASERARAAREELAERGRRLGTSVRSRADRAGHAARDRFERGRNRAAGTASAAADNVAEAYRSNPVALGLGVAALAALAGALIPPTRREDEWLGAHADEIKARSRELADRTAGRAADIAGKSLEAARDEAGKRGYDADRFEEDASRAIDDVSEIGARAARTAREEIEGSAGSDDPAASSDRHAGNGISRGNAPD